MGAIFAQQTGDEPATSAATFGTTVVLPASLRGSVYLVPKRLRVAAMQVEDSGQRIPPPPNPGNPEEDRKLPNGKSQKDAIAKQSHQDALKDAEDLFTLAGDLRDQLKKAGDYVVDVSSVKKTEEIEKLARRIRGRLKT